MGIEPTSKAWEAFVLPLNYTRVIFEFYAHLFKNFKQLHTDLNINTYACLFSI